MAPELKENPDVEEVPADFSGDDVVDVMKGNFDDRRDMRRMGKIQELRRNFRFVSIFGFSMILQACWEAVLSLSVIGLANGGTAGTIWIYLVCWIGFTFVNISMAEMGSMAPTSGGQYHWVSEFAPRKHQQFLSYLMGWLCVLGWQTLTASVAYATATQIQGLVVLNNPDYDFQRWHGTLITIAVAAFGASFNTLLATKLPFIEAMILIIHIFAFFGILVTLWVLAPRADAKSVFTEFTDGGNWNSFGLSTLVGITVGINPLLGADAAVHMSEEIRDAGRTLPQSMILTTIVNGAMGWVMIITFCFCLGDLDEVLATPTGYPFIQIFYNTTRSTGSATAMVFFIIAMGIFSNLTMIATASRQLFAFARDKAVPWSQWFGHVTPSLNLPVNAIWVTFFVTSLLSLINIGSSVALNDICSLATAALLSSYICSIGCMTWRRLTNNPLLPARFSLGKYGLAINIASLAFLVVGFVFAFFPTEMNPTGADMNWTILIYGVVVIFSLVYYYFKGRHQYVGPVEYVRKLE